MFAMLLCVVHSIIIGQGMRCLFSTPPLKNVSFYLKIRKTRACIMPKCYLLINEEKCICQFSRIAWLVSTMPKIVHYASCMQCAVC